MKKKHIDDPVDIFGEAYELMLERVLAGLEELKETAQELEEKAEPLVHRLVDKAKQKAVELEELTEEQAERLAETLKHDLQDAVAWMDRTGGELKDWVGFESGLIKMELLDLFAKAAAPEIVDLTRRRLELEQAKVHTGQITGPGVLGCNACDEKLHFNKPGRVPPCPKCGGTEFHVEVET